MDKGKLIEAFFNHSNKADTAKREHQNQALIVEKLASEIANDKELSELVMGAGVLSCNGDLLKLNNVTNRLEVSHCTFDYSIKSKLTDKQEEVIINGK